MSEVIIKAENLLKFNKARSMAVKILKSALSLMKIYGQIYNQAENLSKFNRNCVSNGNKKF